MENQDHGMDADLDLVNYSGRIAISAYFVLVSVAGIVGNTMVIVAIAKYPKIHSITNIFIGSLAVSDLALSCLLPFMVVGFLSTKGWPLSHSSCAALALGRVMTLGSVVWNLVIIGLNRLVIVTKSPSIYRKIYQPRAVVLMIALTWMIPLIVVGIPYASGDIQLGYDNFTHLCSDIEVEGDSDESSLMTIIVGVSLSCVPLFIALGSYIWIIIFIKGYLQQRKRLVRVNDDRNNGDDGNTTTLDEGAVNVDNKIARKRKKKVKSDAMRRHKHMEASITRNCFYVLLGFIICITPYGIVLLGKLGFKGLPFGMVFVVFNGCLNPIIYGTNHPQLKRVMRRMLARPVCLDWGRDSSFGQASTTVSGKVPIKDVGIRGLRSTAACSPGRRSIDNTIDSTESISRV